MVRETAAAFTITPLPVTIEKYRIDCTALGAGGLTGHLLFVNQ